MPCPVQPEETALARPCLNLRGGFSSTPLGAPNAAYSGPFRVQMMQMVEPERPCQVSFCRNMAMYRFHRSQLVRRVGARLPAGG